MLLRLFPVIGFSNGRFAIAYCLVVKLLRDHCLQSRLKRHCKARILNAKIFALWGAKQSH
jgi:hypothetical protein